MEKTFNKSDFLNKSLEEALELLNIYNKEMDSENKKNFIFCKINDFRKIVKYINSDKYYYIFLKTYDDEILHDLEKFEHIDCEGILYSEVGLYIQKIIVNKELHSKVFIDNIFEGQDKKYYI